MYETLYSIALYRAIGPQERNDDIYDPTIREFWIHISNNAIQMAAINWCKVFGTRKRQNDKTHFSLFVNAGSVKARLQGVSLDNISDRMLNFRDKFAAHEDAEEERQTIPDYDEVMQVMEAFQEAVMEEYDIPELPSIKCKYESCQIQVQECLKKCTIDWIIPDTDID